MKKTIILTLAAMALAVQSFAAFNSGLKKGDAVTPFHPKHIVGPLAGTTNCFPCTFQNRPQVQVWVNGDDTQNVAKIAQALDAAMAKYQKNEFKALVVLLSDGSNDEKLAQFAKSTAEKQGLKHVDIAVLPKTNSAVEAYSINTSGDIKNTVLAYVNRKVQTNLVNLKADAKGLVALNQAIDGVIR